MVRDNFHYLDDSGKRKGVAFSIKGIWEWIKDFFEWLFTSRDVIFQEEEACRQFQYVYTDDIAKNEDECTSINVTTNIIRLVSKLLGLSGLENGSGPTGFLEKNVNRVAVALIEYFKEMGISLETNEEEDEKSPLDLLSGINFFACSNEHNLEIVSDGAFFEDCLKRYQRLEDEFESERAALEKDLQQYSVWAGSKEYYEAYSEEMFLAPPIGDFPRVSSALNSTPRTQLGSIRASITTPAPVITFIILSDDAWIRKVPCI